MNEINRANSERLNRLWAALAKKLQPQRPRSSARLRFLAARAKPLR